MSKLRIMSHNQWKYDANSPDWAKKGLDCSAAVREKGFVRVFGELKPDIIGCQEVSGTMADEMIRGCAAEGMRYALLWGRDTPIVYKPEKLELIDSDFSLYPDELPGREGVFNNYMTKSWNVGVFRVKEDGSVLIFMTTHLWFMSDDPNAEWYQPHSEEARTYQISIAIKKLDELQAKYNAPAIIVGDFNTVYDSQTVQYALKQGFLHTHNIATDYADETNGWHPCYPNGYSGYIADGNFSMAIDHILLRNGGNENVTVRRFERFSPDYYLPLSDHSPVFIDAEITAAGK